MVPYNKHNPNPGQFKQQKTAIHCGVQCYCVLCKKAGYPKHRYKYHSSEKWNSFDYANTKKDLDGRLVKRNAAVKQFRKA